MTSKVVYTGDLRTTNLHLKSGSEFVTDAPTDNNGLGQAFSPTDTVATGLANCMLTVMGIKARSLGVNMENATAEVSKTMAAGPRRIAKIRVHVHMPKGIPSEYHAILEEVANTCPVIYSLHPDIEKDISYAWES